MPQQNPSDSLMAFMVAVSIFGLATTTALAIQPTVRNDAITWRRPLVGSVLAAICLLGILAASSPKRCGQAEAVHFRQRLVEGQDGSSAQVFRGHHLNCSKYADHVLDLGNRCLCAACTGLTVGAVAVLAGSVIFFFVGFEVGSLGGAAVAVGNLGIILGFFQFKFRKFVRLLANALFVVGAFLILAGLDSTVQNLYVDAYSLGLIVFWLLTRIYLSKWNNNRICGSCERCEIRGVT